MTLGEASGNQDAKECPSVAPTFHSATTAADGTGAVIKGPEIREADAISKRRSGHDVVICGNDTAANRQMALTIEQAIGPWMRQQKHQWSAGPMALPHFQQRNPPPHGHTFYETANAKARKAK